MHMVLKCCHVYVKIKVTLLRIITFHCIQEFLGLILTKYVEFNAGPKKKRIYLWFEELIEKSVPCDLLLASLSMPNDAKL